MAAMDKEQLGARLRQLRQRAGLSQGRLAAAAGVKFTTYLNWEYGRRVPLFTNMILIARALGVSLDALAGDDGDALPAAKAWRKRK